MNSECEEEILHNYSNYPKFQISYSEMVARNFTTVCWKDR